ncbi:MAG: alanine--glyoxylate aminotransferase family protein [Candidatus Tectomicrobia bacterium]|uniref:Alanine--glyoxylate aminotransferase family protein n=1 Tax=Tectimicrobiota bacterium TaxID=2528274 RepID=A0A932GM67_UNCTE|nr:alanine--glyoxylate aminotransferase family protein [Candidatus Tectomicrobia bacterium]
MEKHYLFTPGPTPIPPSVLAEMAKPIIHHRTRDYSALFSQVRLDLKYLFQTDQEVLIFAASGTGAMEGTISNLFSPGDKVLVTRGGKFGERWEELANAYGLQARILDVKWGYAPKPQDVSAILKEDPEIRGVLVQATETSTGVSSDLKALGEIVRPLAGTALIVDAVSALGTFDIPMDRYGLDVVVSASQKALMLPPGLAFTALSPKAWKFTESSTLPKYYFDFRKELKNAQKNTSSYTPAVSLVVGLAASLRQIRQEGLEAMFARHARLAEATRRAMAAIGLEPFAKELPSAGVTSVCMPAGLDSEELIKILSDRFGITVAEGQGSLKGKIFRVAHMGFVDSYDILALISVLEMVLVQMGHKVKPGAGVAAAEALLLE